MNTTSTALTLATISRRSSWLKTGLRPFLAKLSWSEETPTTSRSPRAGDRFSTRTWPTWNTSNVPKVITVLPATSTPPLRRVAPANPTVSTASHLEIASLTQHTTNPGCGNARARSFLLPYTRCNACIAPATNVNVRFHQTTRDHTRSPLRVIRVVGRGPLANDPGRGNSAPVPGSTPPDPPRHKTQCRRGSAATVVRRRAHHLRRPGPATCLRVRRSGRRGGPRWGAAVPEGTAWCRSPPQDRNGDATRSADSVGRPPGSPPAWLGSGAARTRLQIGKCRMR